MTHIVSTGQQKFNLNSWNFCIVIKDNDLYSISIIFKALKRILCTLYILIWLKLSTPFLISDFSVNWRLMPSMASCSTRL